MIQKVRKVRIIFSCNADVYCKLWTGQKEMCSLMNFESKILVWKLTQQLMKGMLGHLINSITWTVSSHWKFNLFNWDDSELVFKFCKIPAVREVRIIFSCDADMYGFSKG